MRPLVLGWLLVCLLAVCLLASGCGSSPVGLKSGPGGGSLANQNVLVLDTPVEGAAFDCPIDQRNVPLGPDRRLRCRGIPFAVTFPEGARVAQEKVGPGTSFLGLMRPAGLAALAVRPATFESLTTNDPKRGLDHSLDRLIDSLAQNNPRVERRYDVMLGTIAGRALDFRYPLDSREVTGTMQAFLAGGWVAVLIVGGPNDSPMYRGSAESTKFLQSLRVVPVDTGPMVVTLNGGAKVTLSADAWLNEDRQKKTAAGVLRERLYALPDLGAIVWLQEQVLGARRCPDLMDVQTSRAFLEEHLRSTRDLKILQLERVIIGGPGGAQAIFVDATLNADAKTAYGMPRYPASAALFCKEPTTLLLAIVMGNRTHTEHRATLESMLRTFDAGKTAPGTKMVAE